MTRLILAALAVVLLLASTAAAQNAENGCTQANPCDWVFDVDEDGFIDDPAEGMMFAEGDWYVVRIFNFDLLQDHEVTLEGYQPWVVSFLTEFVSEPFQLKPAGTLNLTDSPSGDATTIEVAAVDPIIADDEPKRRIPAVGALVVSMALLGVAGVARRL